MTGMLWVPALFAEEEISDIQARFGVITGDVQILSQGAVDWVDAHTDLPLASGDEIHVGDDGEAILIMSDHALWTLRPNSDVEVGHMTVTEGEISLREGTILGKVDPIAGMPQTWRFETPASICAVRGTEFALAHSDDEGTHLGVFEGAVEMRPAESATGEASSILIKAKEEGMSRRGQPLRKLRQQSFWTRQQIHRLPLLRERLLTVQKTWSPFTPSYRKELRSKFIKPAKVKPHHAPIRRRPRHSASSAGDTTNVPL